MKSFQQSFQEFSEYEKKRLTHVAYLQLHLDLSGLPSGKNLDVAGYLKDRTQGRSRVQQCVSVTYFQLKWVSHTGWSECPGFNPDLATRGGGGASCYNPNTCR